MATNNKIEFIKRVKSVFLITFLLFPLLGFLSTTERINTEAAASNGETLVGNSNKIKIRTKNIPITGNVKQLKYFFDALSSTRSKKIRIAHYGDSMLLGDVISEYVRDHFQRRFGGKGVGFLSVAANDWTVRKTTSVSFSDDWEFISLFTRNDKKIPTGIAGTVSIPDNSASVEFERTNFIKSVNSFNLAKLYYGNVSNNSKLAYSVDKTNRKTITLPKAKELNEVALNLGRAAKALDLEFESSKGSYIYGISLESGNGVYLDNFPVTGNSGISLIEMPQNLLREFSKYLDYKLIILNFGANVPVPRGGTYSIYEKKMLGVIDHLKKAFPKTSFLLISVADKVNKKGTQFYTAKEIPLLLKTQKRIAKKANIAFWNLFEAMGGNKSMVDWVDSAPPLALKDYRHFTHDGGKKIAELLFNSLMAEYNNGK